VSDERRSKEKRFDKSGSGQRRPGPHQRRLDKAAQASAPASSPAQTSASRAPSSEPRKSGPRTTPQMQARAQQPVMQSHVKGHSLHAGKMNSAATALLTTGDEGDATVVVRAHGIARLQAGHLWVYRSDMDAHPALHGGAAVRVVDERGWFFGKAFYGKESQIALRLLTREDEPIDNAFLERRIAAAIKLRETVRPDAQHTQAMRLVHSEADLLPGLIVDRYADCLSLQTLTEATELRKESIANILEKLLKPRAIVERNDSRTREHEGLKQQSGLLRGKLEGPVEYLEGEVRLLADLLEGQKTGAFLDQAENHVEAGRYAFGRALDAFCYAGGFALQLAKRAKSVRAVDQSDRALAEGKAAAERNGCSEKMEWVCANAFDFLRDEADAGQRYDTIVLDPPGFAKSRGALEPALRGYKEINLRAFQMLKSGGVLITASCSYHVDDALFERTVLAAAADANRAVQVIERRGAGRDHPTLLGVPETRYLKCLVLRVL
jgi:23S rRNA (cytosine1962-C5)-methyltransferase